ncbi:hypothetical protein [uncultured Desulfosarcina sp.]|uniref:hypothetical protein n=1 Tax=uncultured Desulfosarcina sp. TaxID=218289 RepID=UPI0029C683F9|nr:hypothetical protein [uncultured Desulfosarcina sp.]
MKQELPIPCFQRLVRLCFNTEHIRQTTMMVDVIDKRYADILAYGSKSSGRIVLPSFYNVRRDAMLVGRD